MSETPEDAAPAPSPATILGQLAVTADLAVTPAGASDDVKDGTDG